MNKKNFKEIWFATHPRETVSYRSEEDKIAIDKMMASYNKANESYERRFKTYKEEINKGNLFGSMPNPPYYPPLFAYTSHRDETNDEWNDRFQKDWLDASGINN